MTRLDLSLIRLHPELSRRRAREVVEKGQVSVDGDVVLEAGFSVKDGSTISWDPNRKALPRARLSLTLLYADSNLVIVDKPAGLLSVPSGPGSEEEDTVLARVRAYAAHLPSKARPLVTAVHRLDRGTSGALALALDPWTRKALIALFKEHDIERRYSALVYGSPEAESGVVDVPIKDSYEGGRRGVAHPGEASRPALTQWRVLERLRGATVMDIRLETGRQHQIRAHMAHIGHPVVGDQVYRSQRSPRLGVAVTRPMLHARILAFTHPASGRPVRAESPLPQDFERLLQQLRTKGRSSGRGRPRRR